VVQAYRFALDPSVAQEAALRSHCGAQRFAFNWGLARVKANLGQREAERGYGVPEELLTPAVSWSAWRLRKDFNVVKHQVAPWWPENSKEAYASGLANLATALANWAASRAGTRKGPKIAFPKFKGKRSVLSVRFTTGAFGLASGDRRHVQLPRIGLVRTHESTRKLARRIEAGTARIRSVTVSYRRGRWQASFCVEADHADRVPARPGDTVGVDGTWRCCPPARSSRTHARWTRPSGACGGWRGRPPAAPGRTGAPGSRPRHGGGRLRRRSPSCIRAPRICEITPCTS